MPAPAPESHTVRVSLVILAVIAAGAALYWLRGILTPLALAVFLAVMVDGFARVIRARLPWVSARAALPVAIVLMVLLFVFFPRIPGPLWDIGLSFGLPLAIGIDQSPTGLGVSASLKPGQTQTGAQMAASTPVLVAEFENWVPPTSMPCCMACARAALRAMTATRPARARRVAKLRPSAPAPMMASG